MFCRGNVFGDDNCLWLIIIIAIIFIWLFCCENEGGGVCGGTNICGCGC